MAAQAGVEDMTSIVCDAYAAGIIDGEGCIQITRSRRNLHLRVMVSNTNLEVLEWLQLNYGGSICAHKTYALTPRKKIYDWTAAGPNATELLEKILPFLIIKEREARIAVQYPHWTRKGATVLVPKDIQGHRQELGRQLLEERQQSVG